MRKKILLAALLAVTPVMASEGILKESQVRNRKGDFSFGGASATGYATGDIGFTGYAELSTSYYLIDNLALGLDSTLYYSTGINHFIGAVGPSIQYNFWSGERMTFYTKLSFLTDMGFKGSNGTFRADLGADYFISKYFSLGPYLRVTHHFDDSFSYPSTSAVGGRVAIHF